MNKLIVIFFLLNVLNIYCQLSCSQYTDSTCGGYTSFKLKCHKSGSSCVGIEVDDGCTINDSNQCVKEEGVTLGENEICFDYGVNYKCRRIKDQCTSYIDNNCGGKKGITGSTQCTKMSNNVNDFCREIELDTYCEVNSLFNCEKRTTVTDSNFDKQYSCSFNADKTTCKRKAKVCSEQLELNSNCEDMMPVDTSIQCRKFNINNEDICKEIAVSGGCTVSNAGVCSGTVTPVDEDKKCGFDDQITTCRPILKTCEDYSDNCSERSPSSNGKTCHQITVGGTPSCKEFQIIGQCKIDDTGACITNPEDATTHACAFNTGNTICKQISLCENTPAATLDACTVKGGTCTKVIGEDNCKEVTINAQCEIDNEAEAGAEPTFDCVNGEGLDATNQKCVFNDDKTTCAPRRKTCEEYDSDNCSEKPVKSDEKTCYKISLGGAFSCKEVKIEDKCTIDEDGNCELSYTSGSCAFNTNNDECKFQRCNETTDLTVCENTRGCGYYSKDGKGCREVTVDKDNCQISGGLCSDKVASADGKECLFDYEIRECIKRNKICGNYFENTCGKIQITSTTQCFKFSDSNYCKEIQVDDKCNVDNNEECVKRSGVTIPDDKICHFTDDTQTSCKLVDKKCEEYTTPTCKNLTYTNPNKKCFYYSGGCHEVEFDNYCTVDQDGVCEEKDDSSLSDTEICAYTDIYKNECKKRNMVCNELDIDICENYTPINNKFCFKFEGSTTCTELTVEDGCQIDSSNQCVAKRKGDACSLDDNNNRCYKTKSGASLLNLKLFSLLILFFIC